MPTRIEFVISTVKGWRPNQLDDGTIAEDEGLEPPRRFERPTLFKSAAISPHLA